MRCTNCDCEIREDDVRWAFEDPYCEDCFSDNYNYCSECDTVIRSDRTYYDQDGNPFCEDCHENQYDEDCPDNPDVFDSDRKLILELSRNWLIGKEIRKTLIRINKKDFHLQKIRDKVGLVESPLYIFGLQDRDEYQLSASPNLIDQVREYILVNGLDLKVIEGIGFNRLGVNYTLRKDNLDLVVNLIKQISQVKELAQA